MCNGWNIVIIVPSGPAQVKDSGMMASLKNIPSNGSVTGFESNRHKALGQMPAHIIVVRRL